MYLLDNPIRPYPWGSPTAIPELLGVPPTGEPQAELWMGAHPASPSVITDGDGDGDGGGRMAGRSLTELIAAEPERHLGAGLLAEFGPRLPFLLKLLAAAEPLSLQAHPDPARARAGYERENAAGIDLAAPDRNYKDPYAKPEMICALTPLEALVGFRPPADVETDAKALGITDLLAPYLGDDVRAAFTGLLELDGSARADLVGAVVDRVDGAVGSSDPLEATSGAPGGPAATADLIRRLGARYPSDPGVVAALLLNRIVLTPGEAVFLPAGNLHAYIEGFGIELLANSDNVLRGGLTGKHIDLPELLAVLDFESAPAGILRPAPDGLEAVFATPAPEFRMSIIELSGAPVELAPRGPQILLCTAGEVVASAGGRAAPLRPGRSAYAPADDGVATLSGTGTIFRATAGIESPHG